MRACSGPTTLGLQPGARWRPTMLPCASMRMHSVLVPPPSTPILKDMALRELLAEPVLVFRADGAVVFDRARHVLAAQHGQVVAIGLQPFHGREHEPVEQRGADERARGPGHD